MPTLPPQTDDSKRSWKQDLVILTLILGALFGFALGERALWDPDEGRYTEIPREMLETGDYVTPRLNGVKYFEKPVLFYWQQALAIKAFGLNEWAARLWPALFALAGCLVVYAAGRRLYGRRAGLLAAGVLATSPLYYFLARVITLDMAVTALLTAAMLAFLMGYRAPPGAARRWYFWGFYALTALATLTKGLIGIVIPGMVIGAWMVLLGQWRLLRSIYLPSGLALFLLIVVPWHVLVSQANPEFAQFYFIHEHFQRYLTTVHQRYQPAWSFIPVLLLGIYPWTAFLLQAIGDALPDSWRQRRQHPDALFLMLWAGVVFAFFSFSSSKLIAYILPVLPPLALLIGRYLARLPETPGMRSAWWALLGAGLALALTLMLMPRWYPGEGSQAIEFGATFGGLIRAFSGFFLATAIVAAVFIRLRRPAAAVTALVLISAVALSFAAVSFTALDDRYSVKSLVMALKPRLQPADEVMAYRTYYQELPVYLGRRVTVVEWRGELEFGTRQEDTSAWMIDDATFWRRWQGANNVYLITRRENYESLRASNRARFHLLAQTRENVLISNKEPPS